jgi:hypothetical protein
VTERDPREPGIDRLLRQSLSAPIPTLSPDFDKRLARELTRDSHVLRRYRRLFLCGYGALSAATSAALMRNQGLDWPTVAAAILAPLALLALVSLSRRNTANPSNITAHR